MGKKASTKKAEGEPTMLKGGVATHVLPSSEEELKALFEDRQRMDAAEREDRKWEQSEKRFQYHLSLFREAIKAAKSNAECIVICRDALDENANYSAHHDHVWKHMGEAGEVSKRNYFLFVKSQLYYRLRVKEEESSPLRGKINAKGEFDYTIEDVIGLLAQHKIIYEKEAIAKAIQRSTRIEGVVLKAERRGKGKPIKISVESFSALQNKLTSDSGWKSLS